MFSKRPPRLADALYRGFRRYFLTCCTELRHPAFSLRHVAEPAVMQLRQSASRHDFAVVAYCFMPDHVHALVEGTSDAADFLRFAHHFKQLTGYHYQRSQGRRLWQGSFFDHILRNEESSEAVARYILGNPIRAGLAREWGEYPFCGSDTFDYRSE